MYSAGSHLSASDLKQAIQLCILEELPPSSRAASISSIAPVILASPVAQYSRCSCTSLRVFFLPTDSSESDVILFISAQSFLNSCTRKEGKGREGKGREGKGREGKGREGKGREGKGREGKGREGKGREGKGREGKGREGKGREGKGREALSHMRGSCQRLMDDH